MPGARQVPIGLLAIAGQPQLPLCWPAGPPVQRTLSHDRWPRSCARWGTGLGSLQSRSRPTKRRTASATQRTPHTRWRLAESRPCQEVASNRVQPTVLTTVRHRPISVAAGLHTQNDIETGNRALHLGPRVERLCRGFRKPDEIITRTGGYVRPGVGGRLKTDPFPNRGRACEKPTSLTRTF